MNLKLPIQVVISLKVLSNHLALKQTNIVRHAPTAEAWVRFPEGAEYLFRCC